MHYDGPVIDVDTHVFWADGERYPLPPGRPEGDRDTAADGGPYAPHLAWVARKLGADRVLFGSDFPFASTPAEALAAVRSLGFDLDEERQLLHDNASSLLGL